MDANMETIEESASFENETAQGIVELEKSVQTDAVASDGITMTDAGVNVAADWEEQLALMLECGDGLAEDYSNMVKEWQREDAERQKATAQLQKKKAKTTRQHQVLLEKLDTLRVKLQLNNSKSTRKNYLSKKQEACAEKSRAEDERDKLSRDLQESAAKLSALTREQDEEQRCWREELDDLKEEMEKIRREAKDAESRALRDQVNAVEAQRDVAMERIQAWLTEVSEYVSSLRPFHHQEKASWATKEAAVRNNQAELEKRFQEVLARLQEGRELESLPRINVPALPRIPTAELNFRQMMMSQNLGPPSQRAPQYYMPPQPHLRYYAPPPLYPQCHPPPHAGSIPTLSHSPTPPANQVVPSTPAAASSGPLDKVLDKLGARFPQCTRTQLTHLLQQVKSARGTLAGISVEQVGDQVGLALARGDAQRPPPAEAAEPRKLCLICQKAVDPGSRHPLTCTHTIHRDCICIWIQSSGNNSCPFCPTR
ncbi:RING finger protein 214 [Hippocampus comes]|uniref:RING finger protein 214 n=1 Tax=Hippocampus comes TaxID=109280 RepID=UPI00094ED715|nr:PREDICTED: RING finger protein 214 [Hippocampus comes]